MCPCVFSAEFQQKHLRGKDSLENSWFCPEGVFCFSPAELQRTHFDGNNNWDETLFENKNAMREKNKKKKGGGLKESHPSCYSRQNVSLCFFCRISAKTPSGQRLSGELMVLPRRCFLFLSCRTSKDTF